MNKYKVDCDIAQHYTTFIVLDMYNNMSLSLAIQIKERGPAYSSKIKKETYELDMERKFT